MSLALDGRHGTSFGAGNCMMTNEINTTKWAQVDLEMSYSIHTVRILNRGDGSYQTLANFSVYVYEEDPIEFPMANKKLCAHYPGTVGAAEWAELSCESHVTGRYVRVSKFNPNPELALHICEMEVYGERARGSGIQMRRTENARISNPILMEETTETLLTCLSLCYAESLCYGVNFKPSTGDNTPNCQLVYNDATNLIEQDFTGWDAFVVDSATSRMIQTCPTE
ncbi:fucolectin-like [Gigantopelta aegis]|uniref:fucolectin-like n=1 Tax=Gigantopelta aegis TaxID=1735272 RepID=UPI001B88ADA4|nr:fucolectin-like [Gigantopelta aegis]